MIPYFEFRIIIRIDWESCAKLQSNFYDCGKLLNCRKSTIFRRNFIGLGIVKDFLPHEFHVVSKFCAAGMIMEIIDIQRTFSYQLGVVAHCAAINMLQRIAQRKRKHLTINKLNLHCRSGSTRDWLDQLPSPDMGTPCLSFIPGSQTSVGRT